jgi:WD40 repeat protein
MSSPTVGSQEAPVISPLQKFEGHTNWVSRAIHLPGGQQIMTSSGDNSLRVWNLKSGKQIGDKWRDGESEVWTIALSPDGKKVIGGLSDGGMRLWDIDTGKVVAKWMGHTKEVLSVCWSRDGQRVLSGSDDGTAREWDVEKGETILGPIKTGYEWVFAVVYSPDMTMFATGGHEEPENSKSPVKIWDVKTGALVAALEGHTDWVGCLAWTPDGKTLISGSADRSIRTWNTSNWKQIAVLEGHTGIVYDIATSPNGRILASASWDKTARIWNIDNNQPISSPLKHANTVNSVSFSADGKLLATSCWDSNAYAWDISAIVKEAGLDELLLDQRKKSVLVVRNTFITLRFHCIQTFSKADATRRPVRQPIKVYNRVPQGFFDSTHHVRYPYLIYIVLFFFTSMFSAFCTSRSPRYAITTQHFSLG